jgi:membrane protease YdiL (CAAX protease family)
MIMKHEASRRDAAGATNRTYEGGPAPVADGGARHRARRGLALYGAVVVALSAPLQAVIIRADLDGGANGAVPWLVLITGLMFVPAIASAAARLALREGFADVAFHAGGRRGRWAILAALAFPVAVGSVAYGAGWATGLVQFAPPPASGWAASLAVYAILNLVLVSGEEIGWRGYMLTRLIDAGVPTPLLASGLLWGLWHVPLVLWAGYADGPSPALSAVLLLVATTAFGHVLARLRLETGSVWPAVVAHATWNVAIQAGFDPTTTGAREALWLGENGLLTALALVIAAAIASRKRWTIARHPDERARASTRHGWQP